MLFLGFLSGKIDASEIIGANGGKKGENAIIPIRYYRNKKSGKDGERGWTNWAGKGKKEKGIAYCI